MIQILYFSKRINISCIKNLEEEECLLSQTNPFIVLCYCFTITDASLL